MQDLFQKFNTLRPTEKFLLIFCSLLLIFILGKFFLYDIQQEKLNTLERKMQQIEQQERYISKSQGTALQKGILQPSNTVITNYLQSVKQSGKLKNIRSLSSGKQRYEFDEIEFAIFLDLLSQLEKNGSQQQRIQIKSGKKTGMVNAVIETS